MLYLMRLSLILAAVLLAGCGSAPAPVDQSKAATALEPWYPQSTRQLAAMARQAETLLASGQKDQAADVISAGQPLLNRLLSVSRPTLEAMEAVSDFDQLYGQLLAGNGYYGEARLLFQKNASRWKLWQPQTPETERRLKLANDSIADCDRQISKQK